MERKTDFSTNESLALPPSLPPPLPSLPQAVFKNHQETNKADLWSLHSWLGLAVFILFLLNYTIGVGAFFLQLAPQPLRASILPYHVLLGITLYLAAIFTAETGKEEEGEGGKGHEGEKKRAMKNEAVGEDGGRSKGSLDESLESHHLSLPPSLPPSLPSSSGVKVLHAKPSLSPSLYPPLFLIQASSKS
jgi:hypothetical protein